MPQRLAASRIHGFKGAGIVSEENEAASRAHDSAAGVPPPDLRVLPRERTCVETVGQKNFLGFLRRNALYPSRVVRLAFLESLRGLREVILTFFQTQDIKRSSQLAVGRCEPVGCSRVAGA